MSWNKLSFSIISLTERLLSTIILHLADGCTLQWCWHIGDMTYHGHLNKQVEMSKSSNEMKADLEIHFFMFMFLSSYLVSVVGMLMWHKKVELNLIWIFNNLWLLSYCFKLFLPLAQIIIHCSNKAPTIGVSQLWWPLINILLLIFTGKLSMLIYLLCLCMKRFWIGFRVQKPT